MKKVIVAAMLFVSVPCFAYTDYQHICTGQEKIELAHSIIQCAQVSNTKSDEEGEDVVAECGRTMTKALCTEYVRSCIDDQLGSECAPWSKVQFADEPPASSVK